MSLVIAKIENRKICVLADTRVTPPESSDEKPFDALKIFFFNRMTSVACSGLTHIAHKVIFGAYEKYNANPDFELLTDEIEKSRERQECPPDFLLLNLSENPIIRKIWDNGVSEISPGMIAWIGDADAAQFVAENYQSDSIFGLQRAFDLAIDSPDFPAVGGYSVLAEGKGDGFRFIPYIKLTSPPTYEPSPDWQSVDFGTAESGGFGFTTVAPKQAGDNGYGIYFFQGKFGYFFHVDIQRDIAERLIGRKTSLEGFVRSIEREIHVPLEYGGKLD